MFLCQQGIWNNIGYRSRNRLRSSTEKLIEENRVTMERLREEIDSVRTLIANSRIQRGEFMEEMYARYPDY